MKTDDKYFCNGCKYQILKEKTVFDNQKKEVPYCTVFKEWINLDLKCYDCLVAEDIISGQGV